MKGSKKYSSYEYAHMAPELLPPGKAGKGINLIDKKLERKKIPSKSSKSERIRSTKPGSGDYE